MSQTRLGKSQQPYFLPWELVLVSAMDQVIECPFLVEVIILKIINAGEKQATVILPLRSCRNQF